VSTRRLPGARRLIAVAATGLLVATVVTATDGAQAQPTASAGSSDKQASSYHKQAYRNGNYIVLMAGRPAAVYNGGVQGLARSGATKTAKYDSTSRAARAYREFLTDRQDTAARSVGARPYYHYANALNGFAARLTGDQASQLAARDGVLAVVRDTKSEADTTHTPSFLGLSGSAGVWRRLGGTDSVNGAGKGIIIGIIDSGINDESHVFDSVGDGVPADWHGVCDTGADDSFQCNDKLIGGRYFDEAATVIPEEFASPDDFHGHGTHVAATAGGNYGVHSVINGIDFGATSGMAPAAKVAAYKVCWENPDHLNCSAFQSDSVAAIDAAVSDGVDVLNFSIGGTSDNPIDPVELAYMYAADAGVFVANSGGNSGPDAATVEHPSPWLTTVAAATHINYESTVLLGDGTRMVGASISPDGVDESPLVYGGDVAATGEDPEDAALCLADTLDPALVAGAIVICDRGGNGRLEKSQAVNDAGGVGAVIVNVVANNGVVADVHSIPTVHLEQNYREALLAYAETADPTASILAGENEGSQAPEPPAIAGFSSRGPSPVADGDLLKPDIAAPGVNVNAATSPEGTIGNGNDFGVISGTSMASPHIAGLAALIMQKHPNWGPMEIKSAMMTTARDLTDTQDPFDQGAGFVFPREFMDPGLVYNSDFDDWSDYLAGQGVRFADGTPFTNTPMKASNLNLPSIAVNSMAGKETVKRSVTNVDDVRSTYTASVTGLPGISTTVTPNKLTLAPGETGTFKVMFTRTSAAFGDYQSGQLFWKDGSHIVRSPIVVNPSGVDAPAEVTVSDDTFTLSTKAGFDGTMTHSIRGLVEGVDTPAEADNSDEAGDPLDETNYVQPVQVRGPNMTLRVQTLPHFPDDLDLYLLDADDNVVAEAATQASAEQFTVNGLPKGEYRIAVEAFAVHSDEPSTTFDVRTFRVGSDAGNLTVTPAAQPVQAGKRYSWQGTLSGLDPDTAYLGEVRWYQKSAGSKARVGETLVSVD
jgi:subtilisin family serine protease